MAMDAPTEDDCCHSDCKNCVLDIYQRLQNASLRKPRNYVNRILSQTRYKAFKLVTIEENTPNANVYTFEPENPEEKEPFFFKPGEHVVLRNNPRAPESEHLSRPYTLIPWDGERHTFSVVIKIYPRGKMSTIISGWRVGETVYWRGPYGDFSYESNAYANVVMICMGTGIAPMYALSKHITDDENDETSLQLLYGSPSAEEIVLRREVSQLAAFWNFKCTHFISGGFDEGQKKFNENFVEGRIQREDVGKVLEHLVKAKVLALVCGTDEFNASMNEILNENGVTGRNVHIFS